MDRMDDSNRYTSRNHSTGEIEALMRRHYPAVHRLCASILNDPDEADDAAQESFIKAARHLESFRWEADMKTWLFRIAVNTSRGWLRKRRVQHGLQNALESLTRLFERPVDPEDSAVEADAHRRLWRAVDDLDESHRLPVLLHYVHDLSAAEIAEVMEIPVGTVYSRLHFARRMLQARLGMPGVREPAFESKESPRTESAP